MEKVFNEFKGTKEYKVKLNALVSKQKSVLDSMRLEVVALEESLKPDAPLLVNKKKHYMYLYEEFAKNQQEQTQDYDTKIWTQIDGYAKQFGEDKGFDFVLGNKKDGVVFYSNTSKEVTKEFVEYINKKYKGE
jgi:outer membrane protein